MTEQPGVTPGGGATAPRPAPAATSPAAAAPAVALPVARVAIDSPLTHLDRPFDYLVPAELADSAVAGSRVRVRFAGRLVDGFVLERVATSAHDGRLAPLAKSVSAEVVLTPVIARLARAVADRYAGTLADVLRLAVPPRHGRTEAAPQASAPSETAPAEPGAIAMAGGAVETPPPGEWARYPAGVSMLTALAEGQRPRAVWWAPPGPAWPAMIAAAVAATVRSGRGAVVVVPDHRDVDRVEAALLAAVGRAGTVTLRADLGPAARYRAFLTVSRGQARVVVGTRAAVFAPVARLGLIVVWDDGDDLHAEPLAPYPHTRGVAVLRCGLEGAGLLVGGFCPTVEAEGLVRAGWAHPLTLPRAETRALAPRVEATGSDLEYARDPAARAARLPSLAVRTAREALAAGAPVLIQVPRRGYQPSLACAECRRPARCRHCQGPLGRPAGAAALSCRWCGRPVATAPGALGEPVARTAPSRPRVTGSALWHCPSCSATGLRASVTGDRRTAEELGRAFPEVSVRTSGRDGVLATVPAAPALVISTPGAEPVAEDGYGAVLLLDGWSLLGRPDLRAAETALRRWAAAAALARPGPRGGKVIIAADAGLPAVQALIRWDPLTFTVREAGERTELGFPPATRMAAVDGTAAAVAELIDAARLPAGADLLGPVPLPPSPRRPTPGADTSGADGEPERLLIRVPREQGLALAAALHAARGVLGTRHSTSGLRVQLDPLVIG